jgi:hypothetical protein
MIHARKMQIALVMMLCLFVGVSLADQGKYRNSAHGSPVSGVLRVADCPAGSCAQCHTAHDPVSARSYGLFEENSNRLCFAASLGGCHADKPAGGTAGYPAQESDRLPTGSTDPGYFEYNSGGIRIPGVQHRVRWPGQLIWENSQFSPHYSSPNMPLRDMYGNGSCDNCHNVHGGFNDHDLLDTNYQGIVGSQTGATPANYRLCLDCHSQFGPPGMNDTARMISYYYDRSINPDAKSGHGPDGSGYVPSMSRMPCYDCHNAHGSIGNGGAGGNKYLISDQRPGWYGLSNIKDSTVQGNEQVRRFCFGCHRSSDGQGGGMVEGIDPGSLPSDEPAHAFDATQHCYDCHGRDYSSPTSNNIHNPR